VRDSKKNTIVTRWQKGVIQENTCSSIHRKAWVRHRELVQENKCLHVVTRSFDDFVIVGQTIELASVEVDEHVVAHLHRMRVRVRILPAPLEELPTAKTSVDIQIGEWHRANALEVEVNHCSIDSIQVGTPNFVHCRLFRKSRILAARPFKGNLRGCHSKTECAKYGA